MSYLDDVISKTRSMAEVMGKKSAEAIEISKRKIELIDCKNKLDKAYAVLGKLEYESLYGKVLDEEAVSKAVEDIDQHATKMKKLEEELNQLQNTKICPACGSEVKHNSIYCSQCGASIN